jgi:hypothetical protein
MTFYYSLLWFSIWILCGFISMGITIAYFTKSYPSLDHYRINVIMSIALSVAGPLSLMVAFFCSGFCKHGWQIRKKTKSERIDEVAAKLDGVICG